MRHLMILVALLAGCAGSAKVLEQTTMGGRFQLEGSNRDVARDDAHTKMKAHCGDQGYHHWYEDNAQSFMSYNCGPAPEGFYAAPAASEPLPECQPEGAIVDSLNDCCKGSYGDLLVGGRYRCG